MIDAAQRVPNCRLVGRWAARTAVVLVLLATSASPALAADPGVHGRISFSINQTGSGRIYTLKPDGSAARQLTAAAAASSLISDWSPDGTRTAFDSDRPTAAQI